MNKYKVTLLLMVDPTVNDKTFKKSYKVDADDEWSAYRAACKLQAEDTDDIKHRSVFGYYTQLL